MKVWLTKYALTRGIIEVNADLSMHGQHRYADGKLSNGHRFFTREWAGSLNEARATARAMRDAKIAALSRQLARLRSMKFEATS